MPDPQVLRTELGRLLLGLAIVLLDLRFQSVDVLPDPVGAVLVALAVARLLLVGGVTPATGLAPLGWVLVAASVVAESTVVVLGAEATATIVAVGVADLLATLLQLVLALHLRAVLADTPVGGVWGTAAGMLQALALLEAAGVVVEAVVPAATLVPVEEVEEVGVLLAAAVALALLALLALAVFLAAVVRTRRDAAAALAADAPQP